METARLEAFNPILPVRDVRAALAHYAQLGFTVRSYSDDYGFAARGAVELHVTFRPSSHYQEGGIAVCYLRVADADVLYQEWSGVAGGRTDPPANMPWRMHEGRHTDPDGNIIRFGSPC